MLHLARQLLRFLRYLRTDEVDSSSQPHSPPGAETIGAEQPPTLPEAFQVSAWEVWHVYTAYLSTDTPDLREAAQRLLQNGLAKLTTLPDGELLWRSDDRLVSGRLTEVDADLLATGTAVTPPPHLPRDLWIFAVATASERAAERNIFGSLSGLPPPHVKAHLRLLRVNLADGNSFYLEPVLHLFATGIVLLCFRMADRGQPIGLADFINDAVNVGFRELSSVEMDRELSERLFDAHLGEDKVWWWQRARVLPLRWALRRHARTNLVETDEQAEGDLARERVRNPCDEQSSLAGVVLELVKGVAYCLGKPRAGLGYLLLGEPSEPRWTGFWSASPHVHLLEFSNQRESAQENEQVHGGSFRHILARSAPSTDRTLSSRVRLPESPRSFDDLALYVNEAVMLWVYTPALAEPPNAPQIYLPAHHHQIKGQLIELAIIQLKSVVDELSKRSSSIERILSIREQQLQLEHLLSEAGQYGEVRATIAAAFRARSGPELQQKIERLLSLRLQASTVAENRRLSTLALALAFNLSLLELTGVAKSMESGVGRAMALTGLDEWSSLAAIVSWTLSVGLLMLLYAGVRRFILRREQIHWPRRLRRL